MKIAYIKPTFPEEKRVGLLPQHLPLCSKEDERRFETGYGEDLNISDSAYGSAGGYTREELFAWADVIYCIKVPQPQDYKYFRENQTIAGWVHPLGFSGRHFANNCAKVKNLSMFDVTNTISIRYHQGKSERLDIPRDITQKNSVIAGYASMNQAIMLRGGITKTDRVGIFGSGNVVYGALKYLAGMGIDPILRRRSNVHLLQEELSTYDIFINGVEIADGDAPIATKEMIDGMKSGAWIIDLAADAERAIEGTRQTSIKNPLYTDEHNHTFYVVSNSPSLLYRQSSEAVSEGYATHFWSKPMAYWYSNDCLATSTPELAYA